MHTFWCLYALGQALGVLFIYFFLFSLPKRGQYMIEQYVDFQSCRDVEIIVRNHKLVQDWLKVRRVIYLPG